MRERNYKTVTKSDLTIAYGYQSGNNSFWTRVKQVIEKKATKPQREILSELINPGKGKTPLILPKQLEVIVAIMGPPSNGDRLFVEK